MKEKLKRFRSASGILVTALLILAIVLGLFFLIRSGILVPHPGDDSDNMDQIGVLPELDEPSETNVLYADGRDKQPSELLSQLREADRYVWSFNYIEAWESSYTAERTTVSRFGEKYRIERENLLVICDGERVYRREGMLESIYGADTTSLYLEAGLTSLEEIRDNPQNSAAEYDDPINPKRIRISRTRDNRRDEYEISIEAGLPVTERSYIGNLAYRMVLTDSVSVTAADQLTDEDFTIPEID